MAGRMNTDSKAESRKGVRHEFHKLTRIHSQSRLHEGIRGEGRGRGNRRARSDAPYLISWRRDHRRGASAPRLIAVSRA
jgi:hypothetical protein